MTSDARAHWTMASTISGKKRVSPAVRSHVNYLERSWDRMTVLTVSLSPRFPGRNECADGTDGRSPGDRMAGSGESSSEW